MAFEFPPPGYNQPDTTLPPADVILPPQGLPSQPASEAGTLDMTRPSDASPQETKADSPEEPDHPDMTRPAATDNPSSGDSEVPGPVNPETPSPESTNSAAEDPETAAPGGGTPPDVPGFGETGLEEPNRAAALKKVFEMLKNSKETAQEAVTTAVQAHPEAGARATELMVKGAKPFVDAAEQAARETRIETDGEEYRSVLGEALDRAVDETTAANREALEAAGVKLDHDSMDFKASMTNPQAFTQALADTDHLEAQEDRGHVEDIIQGALGSASITAAVLWSGEAAAMVADSDSSEASAIRGYAHGSVRVDEADTRLYDSLAATSGAMAYHTERLRVPGNITEGLRHHNMAVNEGLEVEWAVGHQLGITGLAGRIGTDRLYEPEQWNAATTYLGYLQLTAPTAQFTQEIGRALERDIVQALDNPDIVYLDDPDAYAGRSALIESTRSMLESGLQEVRRIFRQGQNPDR